MTHSRLKNAFRLLRRTLLSVLIIAIPASIATLLRYSGVSLGAFPTIFLYAPFVYMVNLVFHPEKLERFRQNDKESDQTNSDDRAPQTEEAPCEIPEESPSFYESEKAEETQTYGPLDPPQHRSKPAPDYKPGIKFSGKIVWRVFAVLLIFGLGFGTIYNAYRADAAEEEARTWEAKYNSEKRAYQSLDRLYQDLNISYSDLNRRYDDADFCRYMAATHVGVRIEEDTVYYHTFSCEKVKNSQGFYWVNSTRALDNDAWLPCKECHTEQEIKRIYALLEN